MYGYVLYNLRGGYSFSVTDSSVALLPQNDKQNKFSLFCHAERSEAFDRGGRVRGD